METTTEGGNIQSLTPGGYLQSRRRGDKHALRAGVNWMGSRAHDLG